MSLWCVSGVGGGDEKGELSVHSYSYPSKVTSPVCV